MPNKTFSQVLAEKASQTSASFNLLVDQWFDVYFYQLDISISILVPLIFAHLIFSRP